MSRALGDVHIPCFREFHLVMFIHIPCFREFHLVMFTFPVSENFTCLPGFTKCVNTSKCIPTADLCETPGCNPQMYSEMCSKCLILLYSEMYSVLVWLYSDMCSKSLGISQILLVRLMIFSLFFMYRIFRTIGHYFSLISWLRPILHMWPIYCFMKFKDLKIPFK
jgi:hypothetical protein